MFCGNCGKPLNEGDFILSGITTHGLIIHRLAHGVISYIHYCSAFRLLDLFLQLYLPWVVQTALI